MEIFHKVSWIAGELGVCKMTVYRLIHAGELEAIRVGKQFRVSELAYRSYLGRVGTDGDSRGTAGSSAQA